jgi:glutamine synthetase
MSSSSGLGASLRQKALFNILESSLTKVEKPTDGQGRSLTVSEYFGINTFGLTQMREKLPAEAYSELIQTLEQGKKLSKETSNVIAGVIKTWALQRGATHFCHWFHPMTGSTAEKHDAFINVQHSNHSEIRVIETFSGSQLVQGEPDASSLPSGGMRTTFEARGYTAWDPSSPFFIVEDQGAKVLYIPSVFFGYHGQSLDIKTPLLRSVEALSKATVEFLKLLGDVDAKRVTVTLGPEQEYFLVDKNFVALRPDLMMTGRTLIGAPSTRGQQMEDHYFGAIPRRVIAFMEESELELYKLGIPVKTRHNEVAPSQFEVAPVFEEVNVATDHNTLTMEVLRKTALQHGMVCLLHEKPFAGINGSGKHNNWSISNDKGENLLEPGRTPHQNLRFLAILSVILKAVHDHADVLRAGIASPGNDHRLGANEAPPAIFSVFLGSQLDQILNALEKGGQIDVREEQVINLGVKFIPDISKDNTDRNRTSPFAFTGNKFEFRAVGSSTHVGTPMTLLNAAVASAFRTCTARLKELLQDQPRDAAVMTLVRELIQETKNIRYEGNNYSAEWAKEAESRGLSNHRTTPEAIMVLNDSESTRFLVDLGVYTPEEVQARFHVAVERYNKTIQLELETLAELTQAYVIPALEQHLLTQVELAGKMSSGNLKNIKSKDLEVAESLYLEIRHNLSSLRDKLVELAKEHDEVARLRQIGKVLRPLGEALRANCDQVEATIPDELWPLPKYREMLFANLLV